MEKNQDDMKRKSERPNQEPDMIINTMYYSVTNFN